MSEFNVLISSAAAKIPLIQAVRQAASRINTDIRLIAADSNPSAIAQYFVDEFWLMPSISNMPVEQLIDYCLNHQVKAIIPTRDGELNFFAKHYVLLQNNNISVMSSPLEAIANCLDKFDFYKLLKQFDLPAIPTESNLSNIEASRFVVKERFGAGSQNIGLNLSKAEALTHAKKLHNPIFQPYIEGQEVSVDIYVDQIGKVKGSVVRSRDVVIHGESQVTTVIRNEKLESLCEKLARDLGLRAHAVMQVFIDKDEGFNIVECNPRFGGASTLSIRYGLDSFYWFLLEAMGEDLSQQSFNRASKLLKQVRYKQDLIL